MYSHTRVLKEFCSKGNLQDYETILSEIITEIESAGCKLTSRYDEDIRSSHSYNEQGCLIRISLRKDIYQSPLFIIWLILHEFGHHISPIKKEEENILSIRIKKEQDAWKWAYKRMSKIDRLKKEESNFLTCKQLYLNTYNLSHEK